ncbi:MAG: hypothetical protein CBC71_08370 [Rhodobacteraceae bacterium TMED111]|nr:hypothetical protein [Marinovum sp.]OUV40085.1 MAG: hypothetical protein CBC71_08370 [Rhodobacteraceae bacterium TMED111]|tara:strand:+ start:1551 stop:2510 length:960 start_codon:yes stop_codon:yes gene_type:complete
MESDDILDQSQENQVDSIDIRDLLDVANAKVFDDDHDLISKTKNFEKVASFFDLIKSDTVAEPESVESDFTNSTTQEEDTGDDNDSVDQEKDGIDQEKAVSSDYNENQKAEDLPEDSQETDEKSEEIASVKNMDIEETIEEHSENQEEFEPTNVFEQSTDTTTKNDESLENSEISSIENSEEYQRGYQDAIKEFESTLLSEKQSISDFGKTLLSVRDDAAVLIEELIKEKVIEISSDFLGKSISEIPEDFMKKVKDVTSSILSSSKEIIVEFNEIDAAALKENLSFDELPMKIREVTDLGRGEFRMIVGKSRYEQRISD